MAEAFNCIESFTQMVSGPPASTLTIPGMSVTVIVSFVLQTNPAGGFKAVTIYVVVTSGADFGFFMLVEDKPILVELPARLVHDH